LKIGVCVKQVPAKDAPLVIDASGSWIRETDISFETNEPDSFALEEALRLKEKHGGEVVAISMGPERAKQTIKEALAKGAERGIHVVDDKFHGLDPLASARSLAAAIQKENFDLILTGLQSELEAGWFQWVELPLPAVLTIQSGINKPRYATLKGIMAAKKKEIASVPRESLGVQSSPTQKVERIYVPQKTKKTEFITGSPKEIAAKLVEKLQHETRVL
jgi:electron transfer flavoprotein beta subunit